METTPTTPIDGPAHRRSTRRLCQPPCGRLGGHAAQMSSHASQDLTPPAHATPSSTSHGIMKRHRNSARLSVSLVMGTMLVSTLLAHLLEARASAASMARRSAGRDSTPSAAHQLLSMIHQQQQPSQHYELRRLRNSDNNNKLAASFQDLAAADQLDEPTAMDAGGSAVSDLLNDAQFVSHDPGAARHLAAASLSSASNQNDEQAYPLDGQPEASSSNGSGGAGDDDDEAMENSHESAERNIFMSNHNSHLRAMRDMFERRQLINHNHPSNGPHRDHQAAALVNANNNNHMGQSSQELSPISIGLDPNSPFSMPPFPVGGDNGAGPGPPPPMLAPNPKPHMVSAQPDGLEQAGGPPALPFGLNPLPHLLGFQQGAPFDGPQRGDQSAHSNHHAAAASSQSAAEPELGPSQKVWPKIFRFTDGRINLSDFEKQKKIRLSNKNQHGENHIESAPIMFDGRQLKRKSFLILHGGVFPGNR